MTRQIHRSKNTFKKIFRMQKVEQFFEHIENNFIIIHKNNKKSIIIVFNHNKHFKYFLLIR